MRGARQVVSTGSVQAELAVSDASWTLNLDNLPGKINLEGSVHILRSMDDTVDDIEHV